MQALQFILVMNLNSVSSLFDITCLHYALLFKQSE